MPNKGGEVAPQADMATLLATLADMQGSMDTLNTGIQGTLQTVATLLARQGAETNHPDVHAPTPIPVQAEANVPVARFAPMGEDPTVRKVSEFPKLQPPPVVEMQLASSVWKVSQKEPA